MIDAILDVSADNSDQISAARTMPQSSSESITSTNVLPIMVLGKHKLVVNTRSHPLSSVEVFSDHLLLHCDHKATLRDDEIIGMPIAHFSHLAYWQQGVLRVDIVAGKVIAEFVYQNSLLQKVKYKRNTYKQTTSPSIVAIPFRLEATKLASERAKGAFYDHYLTRAITGHSTTLLKTDAMSISGLTSYRNQLTYADHNTDYSESTLADDNIGLLLIPGMAQQSLTKLADHCRERETLETNAIRQARRRGQPILGVCAGSWRIWQVMGEQYEKDTDGQWVESNMLTTESVTDHMAIRMAYLRDNGQGVESNVMVHDVIIPHSTMLADAMGFSWDVRTKEVQVIDIEIPVNSIHWLSPKYAKHSVLRTSATAASGEYGTKLRTGEVMEPQESTVEAFESMYGAPILGVQWHFEAFYDNPIPQPNADAHLNILRFMAKAGDSYCQKRVMMKQIAEINCSNHC